MKEYQINVIAGTKVIADMAQSIRDKTINDQRMKAVPPGALPAGPSDKQMYMQLLSEGTWTFNGTVVGTNPKGAILNLWWDMVKWSIDDEVELPTKPTAPNIIKDGTLATSQDAVFKYLDPVMSSGNELKFELLAGYINELGVYSSSPNWLCAVVEGIEPSTEYTTNGFGLSSGQSAIVLANTRVNHFHNDQYKGKSASVGGGDFTFTTLEESNKIYINVDGAQGVGNDLNNSPYLQKLKIFKGRELKKDILKASAIDGLIKTEQISNIEDAVKVTAISGNGAPKTQIGIDGQIYLDYSSGLAYNKAFGKWGNGHVLGGQKRKFVYPEGFTWRPFDIYKLSSNGMYVPDVTDISIFVLAEILKLTPYYVDPINGSDSKSGLSPLEAVNTVGRAIALGASMVYCMEGDYNRSQGIATPIITRNMAFIAYKGAKVNMSSWDDGNIFTWSQDGPVFYTTRGGTQSVYDSNFILGDQEGYLAYAKATTLEDCKSTAGSFFISGTTVYVHTKDGLKPDKKIKLNLQVETCKITLGSNVDFFYMEGITTYTSNGQSGFQIRNNATIQYSGKAYVKNCVSIRNIQGNGIAFEGIKEVYVQNCGAIKCGRDAFNYHTAIVTFERMKAVEINCWSFNTGYESPLESSSNGSTAHDGMIIIRFGGKFEISRGSTVVDVNAGIRSLNFNIEASGSYLGTTASFHVQDGKMWLYNCYAHSSTFAAKADGAVEPPVIYYDVDSLLVGIFNGNVLPMAA